MTLREALNDKYEGYELIEKLELSVDDMWDLLEELVLDEFNEDGKLSDEWREFGYDCEED